MAMVFGQHLLLFQGILLGPLQEPLLCDIARVNFTETCYFHSFRGLRAGHQHASVLVQKTFQRRQQR